MVANKISKILIIFIWQFITGQNCDSSSLDNLRQSSTKLLSEEQPLYNELQIMKVSLETALTGCKEQFQEEELMEFNYLENILDLCKRQGDIEGQVKYLTLLGKHPEGNEEDEDTNYEKERIIREYGSLHIRFKNNKVLTDMATLQKSSGEAVTINILHPKNVWSSAKPKDREERVNRLNYISNQSRDGKLKVYFDSYKDGFFYFALPYVPYLEQSNSSDDWYAITFDDKKRYRINFTHPRSNQPPEPLIIQPEEGWRLEVSTPEKWVKLTFDNPKIGLKFKDRQTGKMNKNDYIKIVKESSVDFYLPSDRQIDIEYESKLDSRWNYMNKFLYGSFWLGLGYFTVTGIN